MEIGWILKVENLPRHREPPGDASVWLAVARVCFVGVSLEVYLWTISRTVAGVILAFTLFGVFVHLLSLAATLHYNCPYQTPPSILV